MKSGRKLRAVVSFPALVTCLFVIAWPSLAQEGDPQSGFSTNASDQAECKRQLNIIYGAIQQYREQHGDKLPDKLSDLSPDFIHNPDVLVCPYVRKRGGLRTWARHLRDLTSDPHSSY